MGGGAWPFLVGGVICLVDSDNERDGRSSLVYLVIHVTISFFTRLVIFNDRKRPAITGL